MIFPFRATETKQNARKNSTKNVVLLLDYACLVHVSSSVFDSSSSWFLWRVFRANSELFDPWEVVFDDISLHRIIGEGAFGKVYRGELLKQTMEVGKGKKSLQRKKDKEKQQRKKGPIVAVKMLQSKISLLSECFTENST